MNYNFNTIIVLCILFFLVSPEVSSESFGDISCITNGKLHLYIKYYIICRKIIKINQISIYAENFNHVIIMGKLIIVN